MMSDLVNALAWYVALAGLSWLVLPLAYRLLPMLPERGYAFLRPLALLLWGFVFWLLGSLGLLANNHTGLLSALVLVAALSAWAWRSLPAGELGGWLRAQRGQIVATELVFALGFVFMLWMRASYPRVEGTEKPMELAFINAILKSTAMPPHDPWLSGYSISYYYFGYLMVAMLAKLLGIAGAVAFNLGIASVFAMGAAAAYGLAFNLLAVHKPALVRSARWLAGLAPLLMLVMGNAEGLLEIAHARHWFWRTDAAGESRSAVWAWLDVKELVNPPAQEPRWVPRNYDTGSWWWWRASRVVNDRNYFGEEQELIDEFPAFSFVLGDLHPHVFSIPFVLLAMGVALNVYLGGGERKQPWLGLQLAPESLLLAALVVGGLAFLNIWDLPIYAILLAGAYTLRSAERQGWGRPQLDAFVRMLLTLGIGGVLLYLPFYLGFTSQAGGFLPNLITPTRGTHLWIMFLPLLAPLVLWLAWQWKQRSGAGLPRALLGGLGFVLALWLCSYVLAMLLIAVVQPSMTLAAGIASERLRAAVEALAGPGQAILGLGAADLGELVAESLRRRFNGAGGWLTLAAALGLLGGLLAPMQSKPKGQAEPSGGNFALLLALVGALLVTAPEFIYLRDQFGTRMNTVFKFYYQAWLLWSVAGTFAIAVLWHNLRGAARMAVAALLAVALGAGFVYPAYAFADIASQPEGHTLSLDGSSHLPAEAREAIAWLQAAQPGVLVEAVGGSYSGFGRYATFSGLPGVMGWPGHQSQWRAGQYESERIELIRTLYATSDWVTANQILQTYDVRYVIVGDLERVSYPVNEAKFAAQLELVFQNNSVSIYAVP